MTISELQSRVSPIYGTLKGYFAVAPGNERHSIFGGEATELSRGLNSAIDKLNLATGKNYDEFKIHASSLMVNRVNQVMIRSLDYRSKLNGLIGALQAEFFPEERGSINTPMVISNVQSQAQYQQQAVIVEISMKIAEQRAEYEEGTPERTFIDKLGEALKTAEGVKDIIQSIISLAMATGVGFDFLKKVFGA